MLGLSGTFTGRAPPPSHAAMLFGLWRSVCCFVLPSGVGQQGVGEPELVLPGTGGSHCDLHPPYTDAHQGADLEQLQPYRAAGCLGELCIRKPDPAQCAQQYIGHRGEPEAQLVGAHRGRRRAIGEQVELALFDAVLHLAAPADLGRLERGHNKPRIGFAAGHLGLADDPAMAAPTIQSRPHEVLEATRRLASPDALHRRHQQLGLDRLLQTLVTCQAEQVVHPVRVAPSHQRLAGKAGIAAQQDAYPWPTLADLRHNACNLVNRAGRGINVRTAQLGGEQMTTAEHVKRQVAEAVVITMKKSALLMPVQRIIRGVEVEDDLLRGATVRIEEQIDEQRLNRLPVMADPVIPRRLHLAQFQPVQRALAGERCAVRPTCREFPRQHRKNRVMPELIMVGEVLVTERDAEHALQHHGPDAVLHQFRHAPIGKAGAEAFGQPDGTVGRSPRSSAPASDVITPPSKAAITWRPSTGAKSNSPALHSVGIGELLCSAISLCRRRTFADSEPRCTYTRVESRTGAAAALRFPSPLIKPDVRISRIRLSDWLHPAAIDGAPMWSRRSRTTPSFPNTT